MYREGQLRDISEVSEVGVTIIQQFRHLGPFTHPLSSCPSVDHGLTLLSSYNTHNAIVTQMLFRQQYQIYGSASLATTVEC